MSTLKATRVGVYTEPATRSKHRRGMSAVCQRCGGKTWTPKDPDRPPICQACRLADPWYVERVSS